MEERKISKPDLVIAATGLLALISMFLPWWRADYDISYDNVNSTKWRDSVNGWNVSSGSGNVDKIVTGPLVWIPMLALMVLGLYALARVAAAPRGLPDRNLYKAASVVGVLTVVLLAWRWHTYYFPPMPDNASAFVSAGVAYGTFIGLGCGFVVAVVGLLALIPIANLTPAQQPSED